MVQRAAAPLGHEGALLEAERIWGRRFLGSQLAPARPWLRPLHYRVGGEAFWVRRFSLYKRTLEWYPLWTKPSLQHKWDAPTLYRAP
jgi:hypothetical protein